MNLLRGAIAGGLAGLVLALTSQRFGPQLGPWLGTILAGASFGLIFGFAFLGAHDGQRKLPLWSLGGWAVGALAFCALAEVMPMRSMGTSLAILSALAGLIGGAGFGFGWGSKRGAMMVGLTSFVVLPFAMWFGWWILSNGAVWLLSKGIVPNRVVLWTLALSGFIIYGAIVGIVSGFCGDGWEPETPVNKRYGALEEHARSSTPFGASAAAGAVATNEFGVDPNYQSTSYADASYPETAYQDSPYQDSPYQSSPYGTSAEQGAGHGDVQGAPTLEHTSGQDSLSFDQGDVALTPYEESLGGTSYDADDDMFFGSGGGKSAGKRNLHPDYADTAPSDTGEVGIGGLSASIARKHERIEVELEGEAGDASIDMSSGDDEDEYGFLYDD